MSAPHVVVVGGSDAGVSAALRARELNPSTDVTVVVGDAYPNFSICGIPYYISGDVADWHSLAHRTVADLEATGLRLRLDTTALDVRVADRHIVVRSGAGSHDVLPYDELVIGTGALPQRPPIHGLDQLGTQNGVFLLHSMDDTFALARALDRGPTTALIVGAGYIGLEMAEAFVARGVDVTQVEMLGEVLPTVDAAVGRVVHDRLLSAGVTVMTSTAVTALERAGEQLRVLGKPGLDRTVDVVLVVTGVRPNTALAERAGARPGPGGALMVEHTMATGVPHLWAAGDCVRTRHRLLGSTYLPLGTTAHKQGRVAGENALGGDREFAGVLGTQVVKVFELAAARTGIKDAEARLVGFDPVTVESSADDHKAYYPGSHSIRMRVTADRGTRRLLGVQMVGHKDAAVAKRIDIAAAAIQCGMTVDELSDLDLSYTPPLGSPWDAVQVAAQTWERLAPGASRPAMASSAPGTSA